ncbi:hypothetical protein QBC40DRAFT_76519 [Triangularia verruculosa]|uniref:Threonine/serine exporter-like N-terminal domain-containing protein n=1 Tax=Triangularia verruculosa TaxID=2587418 RepID=A0AAN6XH48_9PEZI|nr:hypothetical protein QBC40DRAFT_76519 [Triangularia verruculosa]
MSTSRPPEDPGMPGDGSKEQQQPSPAEKAADQHVNETQQPTANKGKEKKKVEFTSEITAGPSQPGYYYGTPTPTDQESEARDYFSLSPSPSPSPTDGRNSNRNSVNREQLAAALAEILKPEHLSGPVPPVKPRPVLRKSTPLLAVPETPATQHQSEIEARNRADRLAYSVGTGSVPPSRRNSVDLAGSGEETSRDREGLLGRSDTAQTQDFALPANDDALRYRRNAHQEADRLIRTHTRRKSPLVHSFIPRSGTTTPVDHDLEYIPRPEKYKGGILGTLLKLYGTDEKSASASTSTADLLIPSLPSTPSRTPNRTPVSTPPTSRPTTPDPEKGRRSKKRQSTSTLAGLMESSFMIAAPGTNKDIHNAVSEKIKLEKERHKKTAKSKKKAEEYKIKIHIAEIINRHRYLIKLCNALMIYGAPTHRLEAYMQMSARVLGIEGQFLYLPGIMIISFDDSQTHTTEVKIVRAGQGLDFGRLRDVHEIYKEVVHDRIGVDEATTRLDEVNKRKQKFPIWFRILLSGVASAAVAPFGFEGRYIDLPICFILGCLVGFLQLYLAPSNELYANVFEITAAVLTSCLARAFGSIRDGTLFCFSSLAQASIALILPGYMVLCASLELQSHQMISGSVRMVYALIYTLFLGYGITIGSVIYGYMDENASSAIHCSVGEQWYTKRPSPDYYIFFVIPFTLCLCAINQAKWKQTPVQVLISVAGYLVNNYASRFFKGNAVVSSSLGALTIGVLANLYSRLGRYCENYTLDIWEKTIQPRWKRLRRRVKGGPYPSPYSENSAGMESDDSDPKAAAQREQDRDLENGPPTLSTEGITPGITKHARKVGYGLAAAAMLPAIFVQVPGGLAVNGSLLSGVASANQIVRNETILTNGTVINGTFTTTEEVADLNSTAFNVLFSVIQVAINISVGLSLSALLVYPFGKRRSGLFSF